MTNNESPFLSGCILEEETELTLGELCRACAVHAECIVELVEEGVLEPVGHSAVQWRFAGASLRRARVVLRLREDLGVNTAGAALILDLMDEIESLRAQLKRISN
jgi:chaperone modulatory protein CbpM